MLVEPSRSCQSVIQSLREVGGGDDDNAAVLGEAVHLHQKLMEPGMSVERPPQSSSPSAATGSKPGEERNDDERAKVELFFFIAFLKDGDRWEGRGGGVR